MRCKVFSRFALLFTLDDREPKLTDFDFALSSRSSAEFVPDSLEAIEHCINDNPGYFRK